MVFETFNIEPPPQFYPNSQDRNLAATCYTSTTAEKHARVYIAPTPLPDAISKTKHRDDAKGLASLNVWPTSRETPRGTPRKRKQNTTPCPAHTAHGSITDRRWTWSPDGVAHPPIPISSEFAGR